MEQARAALGAKALGLLHRAMVHEDSEARVMAAEQWGPVGNPAARSLLRRALKDASPYVRIAAAGSLLELGDSSGVKVVEAAALEGPRGAKTDGPLAAMEELRAIARNKIRATAIRALAHMAVPEALPTLRKAYGEGDAAVRDAAAAGLARLGDSTALDRLSKALADEDPGVRTKAVQALTDAATPAVVALVKPLAEDPVYQVRAAVMEALGESGSPLVLPELLGGLRDQNEMVRSKAVAALGRLGTPAAGQYLEEAKKGAANVYMELLAVAGLARLGEPVDLAPARRALYQPDVDTRLLAVEVLEAAAGRARAKSSEADETAALEDLETALDDAEMKVRVRAAAALVRLLQKAPAKPGAPR
ncbi:MAG: HEAT repeat domain-containing protein [Elusimicrobia bacterium]|nr:HEAT repeat domain-containing protein [Elusimicrobiota bacterium]